MASSTERVLLMALAAVGTGCLSGHLLDAGRRRDVPTAIRAVSLDGPDLLVTVRTTTVTDLDRPVGGGTARARVRLADLQRALPVEDLPLRWEAAGPPPPGRPLLVLTSDAATAPVPLVRLTPGEAPALVLHTADVDYPPLHLDALIRRREAPWVWAAMPLAVAADAAIVPPLLLFAPAVMAIGD